MTLKDLEPYVLQTPTNSQSLSLDSEGSTFTGNISFQKRDEYQHLFRRVGTSHYAYNSLYSFYHSFPWF